MAIKDKYFHLKSIKVPLYPGKLVLIFSNDGEKVEKRFPTEDDHFGEYVFATSWYGDYNGHSGYFIVLNFDLENVPMTHGVVAHEASHAMMFICQNVGIESDFDNPEPMTYLVGWITDEIYKFAKQKGFDVVMK